MGLKDRIDTLRGVNPVESDLRRYDTLVERIEAFERGIRRLSDQDLAIRFATLRDAVQNGVAADEAEFFAMAREAADRALGLRPFDVQLAAAAALHYRKVVEMATGEGKTLAAVLAAGLNALTGKGVHVLTVNDYLARRDAEWMAPVYRMMGLAVGCIQEGMDARSRSAAYACDVTYATAKEAGFDFLRTHLARSINEVVIRPYHFAIVDEADSIMIDEARVPMVIAGERSTSQVNPYEIARMVAALRPHRDWEVDENHRNVNLTEEGLTRVETELGGVNLHRDQNYTLLTEVNQSLHAHTLLKRDVDYIVREGAIELVDEFTGRVVADRRWPDGLQAALEAKEGLEIRPGGRILGSITVLHFLHHYPKLAGMTATAQPSADEFNDFYGLRVVPIPPNRPSIRIDRPDEIYTHQQAKDAAIVKEVRKASKRRRPVLLGTRSVEESERLAALLDREALPHHVLNARNDEREAEIIAGAGLPGAVTISTNMAGRGTDIKLGGPDESERARVVAAGGLLVIGTNRHESRRIDDQLRGRAGRQGDPGETAYIVALDDDLMVRFGIDELIPASIRPRRQYAAIDHPYVRREVDRLQRIVEGQNYDIRGMLNKYSSFVESQRRRIHDRRMALLAEQPRSEIREEARRQIEIHLIDEVWSAHLAEVARVREGIHLVGLGGLRPIDEFRKQVAGAFDREADALDGQVDQILERLDIGENGFDLAQVGLRGPSSTWTYLVNDQAVTGLQQILFGQGSYATGAGAALMTGPLLLMWGAWERARRRKS